MSLGKKPFEQIEIMGKEENVGCQHFLLHPQCFLLYQEKNLDIWVTCTLLSASAFNFEKSSFCSFHIELTLYSIDIHFDT